MTSHFITFSIELKICTCNIIYTVVATDSKEKACNSWLGFTTNFSYVYNLLYIFVPFVCLHKTLVQRFVITYRVFQLTGLYRLYINNYIVSYQGQLQGHKI